MSYTKSKYSIKTVEIIKNNLLKSAKENNKVEYEIILDELSIVRKTSNMELFDSYKEYIKDESNILIISSYFDEILYDRHLLYMKEDKTNNQILSDKEYQLMIEERINHERIVWENSFFKKNIEELNGELKKAKTELRKLKFEKIIKPNNFNLVLTEELFEKIIRKGINHISEMPGCKSFAEEIEKNYDLPELQINQSDIIKETDKQKLEFASKLETNFNAEQLIQLSEIIKLLILKKEAITSTIEFLKKTE